MHRNQPPPPANHHSEEESEEESSEEEVEQQPQLGAGAVSANGNKAARNSYDEDPEEEGSSEKTPSQVRCGGLDYGSDGDSGGSLPSPAASGFEIKHNSKTNEANSQKHPAEEDVRSQKQARKVSDGGDDDTVKKTSGKQRIWTPEDESKILKGMIDYKKDSSLDPYSNMSSFYEFVKGSLNSDADATKLKEKIRRLKEKYNKNAKKEADGEAPVFTKTHEAEGYEQSKRIWGSIVAGGNGGAQGGGNGVANSKAVAKGSKSGGWSSGVTVAEVGTVLALPVPDPDEVKTEVKVNGAASVKERKRVRKVKKMELDEAEVMMEVEDEDYMSYIPVKEFGCVVKEGLKLADREKVRALNKKWKRYEIDAGKLNLKKMELVCEQAKLILDAVESS